MKPCFQQDGRRSFLKKSTSLVALYLTPSVFVKAFAVDSIVPLPIAKEKLTITINGKLLKLEIDARTTLLNLLREELAFTGTKKGCEMGQCGACTVHINGKRAKSCMQLALTHQNNKITTIEGLGDGEKLHPMQVAFIKHDAFQCGYCTSGQIMSAVTCVREGNAKSRASIQAYMDTNICRCGAYQNIVDAIAEVAKTGAKI
ncbi:MAG: 2Fe-2S iron-sulfur cluster binding domain-containing protein [Chitinophagaceae bacterium]|nr:2Fe-2S iron-sulfur cluster binding domain-containing protein [Chitinophagaceae bacterium]